LFFLRFVAPSRGHKKLQRLTLNRKSPIGIDRYAQVTLDGITFTPDSRFNQELSEPIEIGHHSRSACLLHPIAMNLERKIYWILITKILKNDDAEATAMRSCPRRKKYDF